MTRWGLRAAGGAHVVPVAPVVDPVERDEETEAFGVPEPSFRRMSRSATTTAGAMPVRPAWPRPGEWAGLSVRRAGSCCA